MLVVIVDDNNIDVMIAEKIIRKSFPHIHIRAFSSGEEFANHFEKNYEEVYQKYTQIFLLLDMYLDDLNGLQIAKKVYAANKKLNLDISMYLLSAAIDGDKLTEIRKYKEIDGFIGKPLSPANIEGVINGTYSLSL